MSKSFIEYVRDEIEADNFCIAQKWYGRTPYTVVYATDSSFMLFVKSHMFSWFFKRMCLKRFHNGMHVNVNLTRAESNMLLGCFKYAIEENKRREKSKKINLEELGDKLRNMEV